MTAGDPARTDELARVQRELEFFHTVTTAMLGTLQLDQVLYVILSGITSGDGLGFNRAFLFLRGDHGRALRVEMAQGPADRKEATDIWEQVLAEGLTLDRLLRRYEETRDDHRARQLTRRMGGFVLPTDRLESLAQTSGAPADGQKSHELPLAVALARCLTSGEPLSSDTITLSRELGGAGGEPARISHQPSTTASKSTASLMTFRHLALVPLRSGDKMVGAILADNIFTDTPVDPARVRILAGLGNLAALAIDRAWLHQKTVAMAEVDGLTGVYNRRYYEVELERALGACRQSGQPLSLVVFDLDHFKGYNDRLGHLVGDHLLKDVARLLAANVREADLVARYGGEEFVLVLANTDLERATEVAQKLCRRVKTTPMAAGKVSDLTLSAGVACTRGELDARRLFKRADRALYRAKDSGRDRVVGWTEDRP